MTKEAGRAEPADSSETGYVCPVCKQPVQEAVKRRKVLGAWVPQFGAGPCHNPDCEACDDAEVPAAQSPPEPSDERQSQGPPEPSDEQRPEGSPERSDEQRPEGSSEQPGRS
ncbi:hypothetical protein ACX6XY_16205 [Streptomyces sp. O3]